MMIDNIKIKKRALLESSIVLLATVILIAFTGLAAPVPDGVTPVTWDVSEEHLMIDSDEARELYERIKADDYPSLEELKSNPVVQELDVLSDYYGKLYGDTSLIDTPEREQLREDILKEFLSRGSARVDHETEDGRKTYI